MAKAVKTFADADSRVIVNDSESGEIKRLWGNLPVVDAVKDLRVFIMPEDIKGATCGDASKCVFARACHRTFGSTKILFWRTVAYLDLPDPDGNLRVERFIVTPAMRAIVERFDRGVGEIPNGGFILRAPSPGRRLLDREARDRRTKYEANRTRNVLAGTAPKCKDRRAAKSRERSAKDLVRNGSGAVYFKPVYTAE